MPTSDRLHMSAGVLFIDDTTGRYLMVRPNYKRFWDLVGGECNPAENPYVAAQREVLEEIGLVHGDHYNLGRLLVMDFMSSGPNRPIPHMALVYYGGKVHGPWLDAHYIKICEKELLGHEWCTISRLKEITHDLGAPLLYARIRAAIRAAWSGKSHTLIDGEQVD